MLRERLRDSPKATQRSMVEPGLEPRTAWLQGKSGLLLPKLQGFSNRMDLSIFSVPESLRPKITWQADGRDLRVPYSWRPARTGARAWILSTYQIQPETSPATKQQQPSHRTLQIANSFPLEYLLYSLQPPRERHTDFGMDGIQNI